MSLLRNISEGLRGLFRKEEAEQEMDDELRGYLDACVKEKVGAGMEPAAALRVARQEIGSLEAVKENVRAAGWEYFIESLWQDVRFGVRVLRKSPGFTIVAVVTLALGIGANTAIFSVIDRVLFNLFPFTNPSQLVAIYQSDPGIPKAMISYPNFLDLQRENRTFQAMAIWRDSGFTFTGTGEAEHLRGKMISANYFSVLGIVPILGRPFLPEEDQVGAPHVALVGESLWKSRFAADGKMEGATLTLDGKLYTIIGVIPSFRVLRNVNNNNSDEFFDDVYVPIGQWENPFFRNRDNGLGTVGYGRLRGGVTLDQARANTDEIAKGFGALYPNMKGVGFTIVPLKDDTVGDVQPMLWMLFAAVGFVILIACTNIANLLLARSAIRTREFAVRAAVGATRWRIIRQSLTEGILLSCAGGALATFLAALGTRFVLQVLPSALPGSSLVGLNARVLLFALGLSILTGASFALVPALKISKPNLQEALKESGRALVGERHRTQDFLIVAETALALVLLVGAGLMIRSLAILWSVNPGFDRHNTLAFDIGLPPMNAPNPAKTLAMFRELNRRISLVTGVDSASLNLAAFPFSDVSTTAAWPTDRPQPASLFDRYPVFFFVVSPDYFQVMRIPLVRGRLFTHQDDNSTHKVTIVDEDFAKTVFGSEDPIGKQIIFQLNDVAEIVGIVGHVKTIGLDNDGWVQIRSQLYLPYLQLPAEELSGPTSNIGAVVRSTLRADVLLPSIRKAVNELDANYVIYGARSMDDLVEESLAQRRFLMVLLTAFAGVALMLATIGIYGVVSYLAAERTQELGIRMALGARQSDVLKIVIGKNLMLVLGGVGLGIIGALALIRSLSSLLFGIRSTDPLTFVGVSLLLIAVTLVACYIPARRATRVDPMIALRHE